MRWCSWPCSSGARSYKEQPTKGDLSSPDVQDSVYCSCRCDGDADPASFCACPEGFLCEQVLGQGGPAIEGSYCVKR